MNGNLPKQLQIKRRSFVNYNVISKAKLLILATTILYQTNIIADDRISKIIIEGNKRVETSTIDNYLKLKIGDHYTSSRESETTKSLYSTLFFEDIALKFLNNKLTVKVVETPFVTKVSLSGNSKVKTSLISSELLTSRGSSLNRAKIALDVEKIKELYKHAGRFTTIVTPKIEFLGDSKVSVTFNIQEGPKTTIKNIYFVGNKNYRNHELNSVILTRRSSLFSFMETNDTFNPARIEYDKELLEQFYKSVGFADSRVISAVAELNSTKEYFNVTYCIDEGVKFNLAEITINSRIADVDVAKLRKLVDLKTGSSFNLKALERIAEKMTDYFAKNGNSQIKATMNVVSKNIDAKTIDVEFVIQKSQPIFIRQINISNNLKTEDKVIRREFKISEGDMYNSEYLERAERNLRNLDYFEKLSVNVTPTEQPDQYDVDVNVQEKSTSSIGFDLGYNTAAGPFGRLSFIETNLIGSGKMLNAGVHVGRKSMSYSIGITEPYLFDKDLSLGVNFFKNDVGRGGALFDQEQSYSLNSIGATTTLGYNVADDLTHSIDYTIKKDSLTSPAPDSSKFLKEQMGKFVTSAVGHTLTYDKTDSRIIPKNGYILSGSQEYAGVGGDSKYLKHTFDAKYYKSFFNNKLTFRISGSAGRIAGVAGRVPRISDRFNLGDYSLRGFESSGVGPRDKLSKEGLGGEKFYTTSLELTFPTGLPEEFNTSASLFLDAGSLWGVNLKPSLTEAQKKNERATFYDNNVLRATVGIGFTWRTRLAPIRVDFPLAVLKKEKYDVPSTFHIKFSSHF